MVVLAAIVAGSGLALRSSEPRGPVVAAAEAAESSAAPVTPEPAERAAAPPTPKATPTAPTTTAPAAVAETTEPATAADRSAAALSMIDYDWQGTGYTIDFAGGRSGLLGATSVADRTITIYVRDDEPVAQIAHILAHELGHAVDLAYTTPEEREQYRAIRGLGSVPWYPTCSACTDYATPAGDFAETFAYWLLGPTEFRSTIAPPPDADQLAALSVVFAPSPR